MTSQIKVEPMDELTFDELCSICQVTPDFLRELIAYGTIEPVYGVSVEVWRFAPQTVRVIHTALHLHEDLEINHAGIALAVDLMDELEELRKQIEMFHKHLHVDSDKKEV